MLQSPFQVDPQKDAMGEREIKAQYQWTAFVCSLKTEKIKTVFFCLNTSQFF